MIILASFSIRTSAVLNIVETIATIERTDKCRLTFRMVELAAGTIVTLAGFEIVLTV